MPRLVLGPLLRWVGRTDATIWVETDAACKVEVLGCSARTFCAEGHHYALVHVDGLEPGQVREYGVALDGEPVWPLPGSPYPASTVRTPAEDQPFEIAFGSCRLALPHEAPWCLTKDEHPEGREIDALVALVEELRRSAREYPRLLVMLGDQVYADDVSPGAREFIRRRRDIARPPGEEAADFEEYTRLYHDAWADPPIRWLLSTVPSVMVFDDHDVHDDWNTSEAWVREMRAKEWWDERIAGGFMSYWIYQHIGNLSPADLERDELFNRVRGHDGDAGPMLREFAIRADRTTDGSQWSYHRDLDGTRLVMIDTRAGRVLEAGHRSMVDEQEWTWIEEQATGDFDHLLLGTSLPYLLAPGMHHVEAWNEAVCGGAWGRVASRLSERIRQGLDLEHWGAFRGSFERLAQLIERIGAGDHGKPPATIVLLSGDVHHAYVAEAAFHRDAGVESTVVQAVCSPFRNPLDGHQRAAVRLAASRGAEIAGRTLARAAGVPDPPLRWRLMDDPIFDNQLATLSIRGRAAGVRIERAVPGPRLEKTVERVLRD